jgi:TRAP-type uncharacterized transport system substrate-binding protein
VFTGPLPWDVRAHIERAFSALGVKHNYVQVDLKTVGSLLESGGIDALAVYTNAEASTPPWIVEAGLATDWAVLNPSAAEVAKLKGMGFEWAEVKPAAFKRDIHADKAVLSPFFYGFHVGLNVPENDVYKMLTIIEKTRPRWPRPTRPTARSPGTCRPCNAAASSRRPISCPCIPASPNTCARRACGIRSGIPRSR